VENLCCGTALPVLHNGEIPGNRAHWSYCPVWQAEVERIEAGRDELTRPVEPESVEHYDEGGPRVNVAPAPAAQADPWGQARRDLDVLAPPKVPS
jgi:hypothetical protein